MSSHNRYIPRYDPAMHAIAIEDVTKKFGTTVAIDKLQLQIQEHERCVLFGCSGAGKSTLLRLIAGLEMPHSGRLLFKGKDLTKHAPNARSVSLVCQDATLYPQLTIAKNLSAALKRRTLNKKESEDRIHQMLSDFGIAHLAHRLPAEISGGEAGRAAFARALIARPEILLLDEPLSQLDGLNKALAIELLEEVSARFQPTMVIVSHDPLDALRLGDRVAILHEGRLIDQGVPEELYRRPNSRLSGKLLSPFGMNWLERTRVSKALEGIPRPQKKKFLGFRPESAKLAHELDPQQPALHLTIDVRIRRHLGFTNLIGGTMDGNTIHLLTHREDISAGPLVIGVPATALCWVDD